MRKGKYASKIKTDHFINLLLLLNIFIIITVFRFILNKLPLNDIKYQLCYLKRCLCTQKLYLFIVKSFFYYYLFFFCVCILLPKGINEFVVFLCIVHVWFLLFTLLPRFLLKGQFFSQNKNSVSECILIFICKNVASKSLYKIHPFPLMLMQRNEMIHVYTVRNLINNLISLSFGSQLRNGCKYKIQYY
jgi:hypothetical protein